MRRGWLSECGVVRCGWECEGFGGLGGRGICDMRNGTWNLINGTFGMGHECMG